MIERKVLYTTSNNINCEVERDAIEEETKYQTVIWFIDKFIDIDAYGSYPLDEWNGEEVLRQLALHINDLKKHLENTVLIKK